MNVQEVEKRIAGRSDLAIHGAAPDFDEPLHVGRPNTGSRETFDRLNDEVFEGVGAINGFQLVQRLKQKVADFLDGSSDGRLSQRK